jgi:hypothetical protein
MALYTVRTFNLITANPNEAAVRVSELHFTTTEPSNTTVFVFVSLRFLFCKVRFYYYDIHVSASLESSHVILGRPVKFVKHLLINNLRLHRYSFDLLHGV